jgi:hypothetical protein
LGKDKGIDYQEEAMTPEQLDLYRQLSETKIYRDRFRNKFEVRDMVYVRDSSMTYREWRNEEGLMYHTPLWLPPVFDPENPERCLWGMVDWRIRTRLLVAADREIKMFGQPFDRLDIALIRAILKQEET